MELTPSTTNNTLGTLQLKIFLYYKEQLGGMLGKELINLLSIILLSSCNN